MRYLLLLLLATLFISTQAQVAMNDRELIQFSGVVVSGDSLTPVPFTNILIKHSYRGTISDVYGYFSFVAQEGDTIIFSAVGFKRSQFTIPMDLSLIHI